MTTLGRLAAEVRRPLFRNAYALLLASFLTSGLGIVYWAVAARIYPASEVGLGASLISTLMFAASISQLNLQSALYRYVPQAGHLVRRLLGGAYLFVLVSAFVVGAATALIGAWLGVIPDELERVGPPHLVAFVISVVVWSVFAFQDHVLASLRLTVWIPIENVAFALVKLAMLVVFIGFHPFGIFLSWVVSAALGVSIVSGVIFGVVLPMRRHGVPTLHIRARDVARYAAADYVAGIFATAASSLMPVLVFVMLGPLPSGHFYPVWLIGVALRLAPVAMFSSLMVESAAGHADFQRDGRRVLARVGLLLGGPVVLLTLAAPLALLVFGPDYAEAGAVPMRLLAVATIPFTINAFATFLVRARAQMRMIILIDAGIAIPSLILAIVLTPVLGLSGVALAVLASQSLVAVIVSVTLLRPVFASWRAR